MMFQDRINKLEDILRFPEPDQWSEDHYSFYISTSSFSLHWIPRLLSISYIALSPNDPPRLHHLYYFCISIFSVDINGDRERRRYEYEEIY